MKPLQIGDKLAKLPLIQGGMGVGVSLSRLAGAVARAGGIGIISTAQIGFREADFQKDTKAANLRAMVAELKKARDIAADADGKCQGLIGYNIMVATKDYADYVKTAAHAGADVIISGAGLPVDLPEYVTGTDTKIAPIVSSEKAARIILKMWDRRYKRTADFVVIEGAHAGGHLGFSRDQLENLETLDYDHEIREIIACKALYEEKYGTKIPVIVAGGIFDRADIDHMTELGADGVQIASRFVATEECDASDAYKNAYINAKKKDIQIIQSPVGMPGRALRNEFIKELEIARKPITKCYNCLEKCEPRSVPYCITKALIDAVRGDVENGLVFCGENVDRIQKMTTVHELMQELCYGIGS